MAGQQWNRAQQGRYTESYSQQATYITGPRAQLIRFVCGSARIAHTSTQCNTCFSNDFFGNHKSKSWGLFVVVPEGYQCAGAAAAPPPSTTRDTRRRFAKESFGKYSGMLEAGVHVLTPFVDEITFTRCLKTGLLDCPPQVTPANARARGPRALLLTRRSTSSRRITFRLLWTAP
jgi:hypothetical protein